MFILSDLWSLGEKTSFFMQKDLALFKKKCSFRFAAATAGNKRDKQVDRSEVRNEIPRSVFLSPCKKIFQKSASPYRA